MYLCSPCCWITIAYLATSIVAQANSVSNFSAGLSTCTLECIDIFSSPDENYAQADLVYLCMSSTFESNISKCVEERCSYAELFPLKSAYKRVCSESADVSRWYDLALVNIIITALVVPAISLRCYSRYIVARELWWDDWTIVMAGVALVGMTSADFLDLRYGFGRHIWFVPLQDVGPLLQIYLVVEVLYIAVLIATKVSVLLFYYRVFQRPMFHKIIRWNIWFMVLTGTAFVFVIIFQCRPVNGFWDITVRAKCVDTNVVAYTISGLSIVQDVLVLFLPIPELATLQMSKKKKWSVMVMFSIGGLACITSIIRLKYMVTFGGSEDPSWDNVAPAIWSLIELGVAIICACLPAIRALANHYLPGLLGLSDGPNKRYTSRSIDKALSSNQASRSVSTGTMYSYEEGQSRSEENHDDDVSDFQLTRGQEVEVGKIHVNTTIKIKVSDASIKNPSASADIGDPGEYSLNFHRPGVHGRISKEPLLHSATAIPLRRLG